MIKLWRIGYIEDGEAHYTEPLSEPEVVSEVYKSFDDYSIATGEKIWVEVIEGNWKRVG